MPPAQRPTTTPPTGRTTPVVTDRTAARPDGTGVDRTAALPGTVGVDRTAAQPDRTAAPPGKTGVDRTTATPGVDRTVSLPGSAAPASSGPAASADRAGRYDSGADLGSFYRASPDGPGHATVAFPSSSPLENSGSLTGHILAQGWTETPTQERSNTTRVVIVLALALGLLVAIGVVVVLLANDAMGGLFGGMLSG